MNNLVGLVLNWMAYERLRHLVKLMPIWIVSDAVNPDDLSNLRSITASSVTSFVRHAGESDSALAGRIVSSLDQHFDELSQTIPYSELHVFGLNLTSLLSKNKFQDVGFTEFHAADDGFIARKLS